MQSTQSNTNRKDLMSTVEVLITIAQCIAASGLYLVAAIEVTK